MSIIFQDQSKHGCVDLEAIEELTRSVMHNVGAFFLETLLNTISEPHTADSAPCAHGHRARRIEVREKRVQTVLGNITLRRNYFYDAPCGHGWCPKDRMLGLEGSSFSPGVRRMMARVGATRAFAMGEQDLWELAGLTVSAKAIERECHRIGPAADEYSRRVCDEVETGPIETMYISMDGTGVPMVKNEIMGRHGKNSPQAKTREVKLGCVFTQTGSDEQGKPVRDESSTSYVGAIETAEHFEERITTEAVRRGVYRAKRVVVIGDGAAWIWNIVKDVFPRAITIVDLYHAREHYWNIAHLFFPAASLREKRWTEKRKEELDAGDVGAVIRAIVRLTVRTKEQAEECRKTILYFRKHRKSMQYDRYRKMGLFTGSGVMEAGCRSVVAQRLKLSGMHWTLDGANSICMLRCLFFSHRWEDFWQYRAAA